MPLFKKILIANRGEIAVRVIRACKELGIKTVAVYSEGDKNSMHIRLSDESICIGPSSVRESYLNIPAILSAAEITDAEAIHPGYGFLSENPNFADACIKSKIAFIGPTPDNIRIGGNKAKAKQLMKKNGIPVIPGTDGPVASKELAAKFAQKIGYPLIIKASAGGGGRGIRIVNDEIQLEKAMDTAQTEAMSSFGNGELYIEKYLPRIRHIEVQVVADRFGNAIHLGERDCSIQRRHQKLIEESPSPAIYSRLRDKLGKYAIKAVEALNYRNVGTIEFVVDSAENVYFMEINTRVQVEHPITEMVTGIDIVKEQIKLASGLALPFKQKQVRMYGHAIECRINAEDPLTFLPSPGTISQFYQPGGPGIRVDSSVYCGYTVPPLYDSLIAKLIAYGATRREAIERMLRALDEFKIGGIKTTISFHQKVLATPEFRSGKFDTSFLEMLRA
ncbi:MAG: acetyl-CoA carboxylase biotin carboxylase subunit [Candidatus Magnetoovum sp. WYHC-5]|nr:acetyl-CoA carboxylase biotin carboxylase subunit [Candidatus Magnetoovum sp. WYHC-5]